MEYDDCGDFRTQTPKEELCALLTIFIIFGLLFLICHSCQESNPDFRLRKEVEQKRCRLKQIEDRARLKLELEELNKRLKTDVPS